MAALCLGKRFVRIGQVATLIPPCPRQSYEERPHCKHLHNSCTLVVDHNECDKDPRHLDLDPRLCADSSLTDSTLADPSHYRGCADGFNLTSAKLATIVAIVGSCQCNNIPRLRQITINEANGAGFRDAVGNKGPATDERSFRSTRVNQAPDNFAAFPRNFTAFRSSHGTPEKVPARRRFTKAIDSARASVVDQGDRYIAHAPTYAPLPLKYIINAIGFNFTPSIISTSIGDTVTFEFHPRNHTVIQSSFMNPCKPLA
ncbi:hypothetical protein FB451DRAFT_1399706 [Mycena latifolia]|nr:hypothetical protein FB451DRAFT_1399706 [Mycena latifolia]